MLFSPGVSVIICCYNSAARLPQTLQHLFDQQVPAGIAWEIIVVDNASKDDTSQVAQELYRASGSDVPFRVIAESRPGLNYAREAGLRDSRFNYNLWVDDDNWLVPDYICHVYQIMEEHPDIGMLGGLGEPVLETAPPDWFPTFQVVYALGRQAPQSGEVTQGYVYGAGATIRKSAWHLLLAAGFKSISTDRKGASLASGGDVELGDTLRLAGFKLWFDDRLTFRHFLPKERLTWSYLLRLAQGTGESGLSAAIFYFLNREPDLNLPRFKYLYYKRILWLFTEIVKKPVDLYFYFFQPENDRHYGTFYITRSLALFKSSIQQSGRAVKAFQDLVRLKKTLQQSADKQL